jgi:hypothetical protein
VLIRSSLKPLPGSRRTPLWNPLGEFSAGPGYSCGCFQLPGVVSHGRPAVRENDGHESYHAGPHAVLPTMATRWGVMGDRQRTGRDDTDGDMPIGEWWLPGNDGGRTAPSRMCQALSEPDTFASPRLGWSPSRLP